MSNTHNSWRRDQSPRQYDLLCGEKGVQFYFTLRPGFNEYGRIGVSVPEAVADEIGFPTERDPTMPLDVARRICEYFERYHYSTRIGDIRRLVTFLEATATEDCVAIWEARVSKTRERLGWEQGMLDEARCLLNEEAAAR